MTSPDHRPPGTAGSADLPEDLAALDDHVLAGHLATAAGTLLLDVRAALLDGIKPSEVRDDGDRRSHDLLMRLLHEARPDDAVLSEEGADDTERRLAATRVWIVDPLDGTREFGEVERDDWAVHVALVEDGELVAGAVALPAQGVTLSTAAPPALAECASPPRLVVSRTRPPAFTERVRDAVSGELVAMGSAGAKAMAVVLGAAEVYAHGGGQYEWDSAAPVAVAAAAGLHVSRMDGSALVYNQPNPYLPDVLVCHPSLADDVLAAVANGPEPA